MFDQLQHTSGRQIGSRLVSVAVHCLVLYVLLRPIPAIFVRPSGVVFGSHGAATRLVYLSRHGLEDSQSASPGSPHRLTFVKSRPTRERQQEKTLSESPQTQAADATRSGAAGSPFGSLSVGPTSGQEVRPALPVVFPDPVVERSEIPPGIAGDVVVEVTIDEHGNVIATRILQPFGYGIEDKVVAVLRNWRFTPATKDGVAIPSQQDVHFHFPS